MIRRLLAVTAATVLAATITPTATAATPSPVVIVAGTFGPAFFYEPLAARLRADGRQVAIFQLTNLGRADIRVSARDLNTFADAFRSRTGAAKVDMVTHSQGGLVARRYIKNEGGATEVGSLVNLGTPNYGTAIANLTSFFTDGICGVSCSQMEVGSSFINDLNAGDDTVGAVRYTNLYTFLDELVRPVGNAAMKDGATNVLIQSQCPFRVVGHITLATDGTVYDGVRDALNLQTVRLNCFAL
ncbi:putative lipase [Alloactinosynnema sp. L-07]|uniref:esterase/lipase family protein n=1 Tax=Alloactinosynnema sp. L-07 TaxID=1653480 RepID=UPI00065F0099|nr:alpha/beta fold hydrolase [Alloactinosynnema sp. L-07]CRK61772.1 putative lipase [Alloactinosynnema sp. L-07]